MALSLRQCSMAKTTWCFRRNKCLLLIILSISSLVLLYQIQRTTPCCQGDKEVDTKTVNAKTVIINYQKAPDSLTQRLFSLFQSAPVPDDKFHESLYCKPPKIELWPPELATLKTQLESTPSKIECSKTPDWTFTEKGHFYIRPEAGEETVCDVAYIDFNTDFSYRLRPFKPISNGSTIEDNYFQVQCDNKRDEEYDNFHAGASKMAHLKTLPSVKVGPDNMHVIMLFFDTVSRPHWHRVLSKTYGYTIHDLGGTELTGHNVLGDGTPSEIIPILTGHDLDEPGFELPVSLKSEPNSTFVDVYPFIWNALRQRGYVTLYGEDQPASGLWTYRRRGFNKAPMEHYMRTFYLAAAKFHSQRKGLCHGAKTSLKMSLDYVLDVIDTYSPRPVFAYLHNSALAHDSLTSLKSEDDNIVHFLSQLKSRGVLDNAFFILASDHGPRYAALRNYKHGKTEYLSPYSSIILPPWFRQKHPLLHANLQRNAPMLTTAHDLRETMIHILDIKGYKRKSTRGWSLFDQIPVTRSCQVSEIPVRFCTCLQWTKVDITENIVKTAVNTTLMKINEYIKPVLDRCSPVTLKAVIHAKVAKREGATKANFYEVRFQTSPLNALYEVTMQYDEDKKSFSVDHRNPIIRTNSYARMVDCLKSTERFLNDYCVCKDFVKTLDPKEKEEWGKEDRSQPEAHLIWN